MLIAVVGNIGVIALVLLVFRIRGWKAGINVLRGLLVLGILPQLHARNISILERTVLVKCATYEIGAIREVRGTGANLDWASSQSSLFFRRLHVIE